MIKGKFIDNLPKVYGIYTGGFLAFIILMAILEQAGVSAKAIGISFVNIENSKLLNIILNYMPQAMTTFYSYTHRHIQIP